MNFKLLYEKTTAFPKAVWFSYWFATGSNRRRHQTAGDLVIDPNWLLSNMLFQTR